MTRVMVKGSEPDLACPDQVPVSFSSNAERGAERDDGADVVADGEFAEVVSSELASLVDTAAAD